ncbi:MAG TPA: phosphotransferase [Rubrobacteraceae bacterium]|nr:phosphotransferase [Rubrobacteraceae bacterium]
MLKNPLQSHQTLEKAYAALGRVPLFEGVRRDNVEIEPLGSLTNSSYKITTSGGAYVLRLPGDSTSEYIDRVAEEHNSRIAAAAGVGAEVVYFDTMTGAMVSRFIQGVNMDNDHFHQDPEAPARAALVLRRVHGIGPVFKYRFNAFGMIDHYLDLLRGMRMPPPEGYYGVEKRMEAVRQALEVLPASLASCHNDPWPPNFIDTGSRMYLIDWEFSGMNDPYWDLAHLSVEAGFGAGQDHAMMQAYTDGAATLESYSRLELYKATSDLHWSLWALVEHASGNTTFDFRAYSQRRFDACRARIDTTDFGRSLAAVR